MGFASKLVLFVVIEHSVLCFKFLLGILVPDEPEDVQIQLSRQAFLVRKIIFLEEDEDDEVNDNVTMNSRILEGDESISLCHLDACFNSIII